MTTRWLRRVAGAVKQLKGAWKGDGRGVHPVAPKPPPPKSNVEAARERARERQAMRRSQPLRPSGAAEPDTPIKSDGEAAAAATAPATAPPPIDAEADWPDTQPSMLEPGEEDQQMASREPEEAGSAQPSSTPTGETAGSYNRQESPGPKEPSAPAPLESAPQGDQSHTQAMPSSESIGVDALQAAWTAIQARVAEALQAPMQTFETWKGIEEELEELCSAAASCHRGEDLEKHR